MIFSILKRYTEENRTVKRIRNGAFAYKLLGDATYFPFTGKGTINYFQQEKCWEDTLPPLQEEVWAWWEGRS